jgi:hypothetical protein
MKVSRFGVLLALFSGAMWGQKTIQPIQGAPVKKPSQQAITIPTNIPPPPPIGLFGNPPATPNGGAVSPGGIGRTPSANVGGNTDQFTFKIAKLKYNGGGDWYANPSSLPNLIRFINQNSNVKLAAVEDVIDPSSTQIFQYPYTYMTGHGNVKFSPAEQENLRKYLLAGGFLHIDDNYGMDKYIRDEIKKLFPDKALVEIPYTHPIYHKAFEFSNGLPKIHEHDNKPAQGFGIFEKDRLMIFYSYECDLGDGWEDPAVHRDPEALRQQALKMGANVVLFAVDR